MTGLVSLKAASRRVVSREGAGRALSKRVKVGECFFASLGVGVIFVFWCHGVVVFLRAMFRIQQNVLLEVHVVFCSDQVDRVISA